MLARSTKRKLSDHLDSTASGDEEERRQYREEGSEGQYTSYLNWEDELSSSLFSSSIREEDENGYQVSEKKDDYPRLSKRAKLHPRSRDASFTSTSPNGDGVATSFIPPTPASHAPSTVESYTTPCPIPFSPCHTPDSLRSLSAPYPPADPTAPFVNIRPSSSPSAAFTPDSASTPHRAQSPGNAGKARLSPYSISFHAVTTLAPAPATAQTPESTPPRPHTSAPYTERTGQLFQGWVGDDSGNSHGPGSSVSIQSNTASITSAPRASNRTCADRHPHDEVNSFIVENHGYRDPGEAQCPILTEGHEAMSMELDFDVHQGASKEGKCKTGLSGTKHLYPTERVDSPFMGLSDDRSSGSPRTPWAGRIGSGPGQPEHRMEIASSAYDGGLTSNTFQEYNRGDDDYMGDRHDMSPDKGRNSTTHFYAEGSFDLPQSHHIVQIKVDTDTEFESDEVPVHKSADTLPSSDTDTPMDYDGSSAHSWGRIAGSSSCPPFFRWRRRSLIIDLSDEEEEEEEEEEEDGTDGDGDGDEDEEDGEGHAKGEEEDDDTSLSL